MDGGKPPSVLRIYYKNNKDIKMSISTLSNAVVNLEKVMMQQLEIFFIILAEADTPESWGECEVSDNS